MKPRPPRRNSADGVWFAETGWTVLGPGSFVDGEIRVAGDIAVHGRVEGTLIAEGEVRVEEGASVDGGIQARRVVVTGTCRGRIESAGEVVLRSGCLVRADIEAEVLTIDDRARFFGDCRVGDARRNPPVISYQKRAPGHA